MVEEWVESAVREKRDIEVGFEIDSGVPRPTTDLTQPVVRATHKHHFLLGSTLGVSFTAGGFYLHYFVMPSCKCSFLTHP